MAFGTTLKVYNLDISSAPATALYAEDCDVDVFSLGSGRVLVLHDRRPVRRRRARVDGRPRLRRDAAQGRAELEQAADVKNAGLLVAVSGTDYIPTVELKAVEVSSSAPTAWSSSSAAPTGCSASSGHQ